MKHYGLNQINYIAFKDNVYSINYFHLTVFFLPFDTLMEKCFQNRFIGVIEFLVLSNRVADMGPEIPFEVNLNPTTTLKYTSNLKPYLNSTKYFLCTRNPKQKEISVVFKCNYRKVIFLYVNINFIFCEEKKRMHIIY